MEESLAVSLLWCPNLLEDPKCTQNLGLRVFQLAFSMPNPRLEEGHTTQAICIIEGVQLCLLNVKMCVVELSFAEKNLCQGMMDPKHTVGIRAYYRQYKPIPLCVKSFFLDCQISTCNYWRIITQVSVLPVVPLRTEVIL